MVGRVPTLLNGGNGDDTFVITGTQAQNDMMNGGAGTDSILVTGTQQCNACRLQRHGLVD